MDSGSARSRCAAKTSGPDGAKPRGKLLTHLQAADCPSETVCPPAANRAAVANPTGEDASVIATALAWLTADTRDPGFARLSWVGDMAVARKQRDTSV